MAGALARVCRAAVAAKVSSGGVALDFASPPGRLTGVIGGLAVLADVPGITVGEPVMDGGHEVFGLGQVCGHLSQTRTPVPGALGFMLMNPI